ncbi:hypothetical protein VOI45_03955 [Acidaminococcus fermentans]|jgi:hypothetical protein|nr:hypothetical protein [Acidaminococcus fermentans]MEE1597942.1 hypothetical protein [Acidaminococcus fermentans]MEE4122204.1 hypothetical protein [Acidaminococcus fermentans]
MDSVTAALQLLIIAYPTLFVVMALFAGLTWGLTKLFPAKE